MQSTLQASRMTLGALCLLEQMYYTKREERKILMFLKRENNTKSIRINLCKYFYLF